MKEIDAAIEALEGILSITNDSQGVAGYHLNGNVAAWGEFDELNAVEAALAGLRSLKEQYPSLTPRHCAAAIRGQHD